MKIAAKIFLILSIVSIAISIGYLMLICIMIMSFGIAGEEIFGVLFVITAAIIMIMAGLCLAPSLVISIVGLRKLNAAKNKSDISITWKILILIFGNLISGILLFCMDDEDFSGEKKNEESGVDGIELLKRYKELLDMGAITEEEYQQKKQEILSRI